MAPLLISFSSTLELALLATDLPLDTLLPPLMLLFRDVFSSMARWLEVLAESDVLFLWRSEARAENHEGAASDWLEADALRWAETWRVIVDVLGLLLL